MDGDEAAHSAPIDELDAAGNFREQRVIAAAADVQAGLERCAALANNDRSTADCLLVAPSLAVH
jgi:hypothetical protein